MNYAAEIEKILTHCQESGNSSNLFRDWVDYAEACLRCMPDHVASLRETGKPADDPEDVHQLFERLRDVYNPEQFKLFAKATQMLLESTEEPGDVIGQVYMSYANPRGWGGQFFTPYHVAKAMAEMSMLDMGLG